MGNYFKDWRKFQKKDKWTPDSKDSFCRGEKRIRLFLENSNIKFTQQKSFPDLRHIGLLRFDFFLDDMNIAIEFDGKSHFQPRTNPTYCDWIYKEYFEKEFKELKLRDAIKDEYCKSNNIRLLRIHYNEFKNIERILLRNLFKEKEDAIYPI